MVEFGNPSWIWCMIYDIVSLIFFDMIIYDIWYCEVDLSLIWSSLIYDIWYMILWAWSSLIWSYMIYDIWYCELDLLWYDHIWYMILWAWSFFDMIFFDIWYMIFFDIWYMKLWAWSSLIYDIWYTIFFDIWSCLICVGWRILVMKAFSRVKLMLSTVPIWCPRRIW
jgi:hypothetical protein